MSASVRLLPVLAASLFAAQFPAQATDGYFLNGIGAKAKGAGGVEIAMPQDALAMAVNPASASAVGERLDIGFELFMPRRGARIDGNGAGLDGKYSGNDTKIFILPELAYVRPLSNRVSAGIAISGNGGMNTDYGENPFRAFGGQGNAGVNLQQLLISPTLSVEIAEGHSVGVAPQLLVQTFEAHGLQPFAAYSQDPQHFTNMGRSWSFGAGIRAGYLGTIAPGVQIGAYYQSKVWAGRFKKYAGLFAGQGSFDMPASWGVGASVDATPRLTLGADFKRIEYAGIKPVGTSIAPLFAGTPFGADNGPGFGWRNISVWKVGAVWQANEKLTLRTGYGHGQNPVPQAETLLNILAPGVVKSHITGGATVRLSERMELTGYVWHALRHTVHGAQSIPLAFGGGEADIHLSETAAGLSAGFIF